jgi:hypothetical protein
VRFVVFIPIDGVRSVVYGNTSGSIYHIERFFRNSYRKIACLFDPYHCNYYNKFSEKHKGYLVFNKPKYMPGDTVKFKAFIINKKGKPIKGKVDVMLGKYGNNVNSQNSAHTEKVLIRMHFHCTTHCNYCSTRGWSSFFKKVKKKYI